VLLLVANEFPRKGLGVLLDALALLPPSVHLVCVGKGNPRPYLATVADRDLQRRVHFVPHTANMRAYYAAADIFAFPTQYEAFSLATLEAAGAGLPLLCTRVNGTEELVVDGHNGLFVERDGRDVADKVRWMLEVPDRIRALGRAAHETARAYQWQAIKDRHVVVYQEVLNAKQRARRATRRLAPPTAPERVVK
jgi:UDP-glucose:(heptosyl)LPS alpha-1,3-glucosyltransferase